MLHRHRAYIALAMCAVVPIVSSCSSDAVVSPRIASSPGSRDLSAATGVFQRFVAIGTSVSMGWRSDGVVAASQATSWPAQLAAMAGRDLAQPYIDGTGCRSPLAAPLASGVRISGEAAGADPATLSCAPLRADVTLPVQNVAISAALTRDALFTTPDNITDVPYVQLYHRVLQPGQTQVSTMMQANPKLVSVELGANEVLGARDGIAIPGVSMFPEAAWEGLYDAVLDSVQKVARMGLVAGLISDVRSFPAFRAGDELWQDGLEFAALNVTVSSDCEGNPNLVFVPVVVPTAVARASYYAQHGLGSYVLSCTAGSATTEDEILTPTEVAVVNAQLQAMSAHIRAQADQRGFAYFELGALYGRADLKGPFSVIALMTTSTPYGPLISLDGLHPSAAGAAVLAQAAAHALNVTYRLGLPE